MQDGLLRSCGNRFGTVRTPFVQEVQGRVKLQWCVWVVRWCEARQGLRAEQEQGQGAVLICGCSVSACTGRQGVGDPSVVCVLDMGESVGVICVAVVCDGGA